jgi:hypothetical protein
MASPLPLDKMNVEEKLQAMETLWDDLCRRAGEVTSPDWHGETLEQRESAHRRGEDDFQDWDTAKRNIRDKTS